MVQAAGSAAPTGAGTATSSNPTSVTGLTTGTAYDFYVRANCGGGDFSAWVGPFAFTTVNNASNRALDFDGVDDYVDCGVIGQSSPLLTLEAWVNPATGYGTFNNGGEPVEIIGRWGAGSAGNAAYRLGIYSSGTAVFQVFSGSAASTVTSNATIATNTWTHLTGVRAANGDLLIYINGVLDNSIPNSVVPQASNYQVNLGKPVVGNNYYKGLMDEVRIWDVALSATDVADYYNKTFSNPTDPASCLLAYYTFDEGTGMTTADVSGNGNTGTLTNMTNDDWVASAVNLISGVSINCPPILNITDVSCIGSNDGSVQITIVGSSPPYSDGTNTYTTNPFTITGLSPGNFAYTITSNNGATSFVSGTISEPAAITSSAVASACSNGADGTITVTASGGTGTLAYSSDNGATFQASNVITGLAVGSYDIVVKDANGCTTTAQSVSVTSCYDATSIATDVTCNGGNDGSVFITVTGGTAPYSDGTNTYATDTFTISGLSAGAFSYTITDNNGATASISGTIAEPTAISLTLDNLTNVSCNSGNDGSISLNIQSDTTLSYTWSTGATGNCSGQESLGLPAFNGNFSGGTRGYWFTAPSNFTIKGLKVPTDVGLGVQNIQVVKFNTGIPPTFSATTNDFTTLFLVQGEVDTGFVSTNIQVQAGDIIGVLGTRGTSTMNNSYGAGNFVTTINGQSVTLQRLGFQGNLNAVSAVDVWTENNIFSNSIARVEMQIYGCNPTLDNLTPGTNYAITVTDVNGCTATGGNYTITEPTAITASAVQTACSNGADGQITVTASSGIAPLEYSSDNGVTFQASNVITGLAVGSYDIVVKDANGCTTTAQSVSIISCYEAIASDSTAVSCPGANDGSIEITVTGGSMPFTVNGTQYTTNPFTITGLTAGSYTFTVTENGGSTLRHKF